MTKLKTKFDNTNYSYDSNLNKCLLLLRKGVHSNGCMDSWTKTSSPSRESFYSNPSFNNISKPVHEHSHLGDYHELYGHIAGRYF